MTIGKSLRLRRIFANGRALIVDCDPCPEDLLAKVRLLARSGVDAIVLTPGLLELVVEELAALSVILRVDGGSHRARQLASVQAALEMGVEAVSVSVALRGPGSHETLERFGRTTEDARRLGMPVLAETAGEDWLEAARLSADYGADVIRAPFLPGRSGYRSLARLTGRALVTGLEMVTPNLLDLMENANLAVEEGAHGFVLGREALTRPDCGFICRALHALLHQGVSIDEALAMAEKSEGRSQESEEE
jgi:DhnA family fructose-bisphosphate aldolase class Ia